MALETRIERTVREANERLDNERGVIHVCLYDGTEHATWADYRAHLADDRVKQERPVTSGDNTIREIVARITGLGGAQGLEGSR